MKEIMNRNDEKGSKGSRGAVQGTHQESNDAPWICNVNVLCDLIGGFCYYEMSLHGENRTRKTDRAELRDAQGQTEASDRG